VSTILKALQRLEDEKSAGVARSLDEQIVARRPPPEPARHGLKIGTSLIGGLAVAAAGFMLWRASEDRGSTLALEATPPVAAPVAAPAPQLAAETPRSNAPARTVPTARQQRDAAETDSVALVEVVQRLDAQPADSGAPVEAPTRVAAAPEVKRSDRRPSARKPDAEAAERAAQPRIAGAQFANAKTAAANTESAAAANQSPPKAVENAVVETARVETAAAPPAPLERAAVDNAAGDALPAPPAPVERAAVESEAEPAPAALPASIPAPVQKPERKTIMRAKLPSMRIEKTIWHPDTDRRIAIVQLVDSEEVLRLKEGDAIGPLVVESIKPGSVLFNHDGVVIGYTVGR